MKKTAMCLILMALGFLCWISGHSQATGPTTVVIKLTANPTPTLTPTFNSALLTASPTLTLTVTFTPYVKTSNNELYFAFTAVITPGNVMGITIIADAIYCYGNVAHDFGATHGASYGGAVTYAIYMIGPGGQLEATAANVIAVNGSYSYSTSPSGQCGQTMVLLPSYAALATPTPGTGLEQIEGYLWKKLKPAGN